MVFSIIWQHISNSGKEIFINENIVIKNCQEDYENVFKSYRCGKIYLFHIIEGILYN